jgi:hypothetical protein
MKTGMPTINKDPVQRAMPTIIREKPSIAPVSRPRRLIVRMRIRNGRVKTSQTKLAN